MRTVLAFSILTACGSDPVHHLPDAPCVPALADYSIMLSTPQSYACHDPFHASIVFTNASCAPVTVHDVKVTGTVTNGACTPPPPGMSGGATVAAHNNTTLTFAGGMFCCTAPGCPTPFQCDEHYVWTVDTDLGPVTATADAHLSLDGCNQICP